MSGYIADELRALRKDLVRAHRKLAQADLPGTVQGRNEKDWTVQLLLGTDPTSGEQILSPWLKPSSMSNQPGFKISPPLPPVGSHMRMISPSGVVGGDSYAVPAPFDAQQKAPQQDKDEAVIQFGKTRMSIKDGTLVHTIDGKGYTLDGSGMKMSAPLNAKVAGTDVLHSDTSSQQG